MLSIEHIMTSMMNGHTTDEKEYIAAVIFPDAIRAYIMLMCHKVTHR